MLTVPPLPVRPISYRFGVVQTAPESQSFTLPPGVYLPQEIPSQQRAHRAPRGNVPLKVIYDAIEDLGVGHGGVLLTKVFSSTPNRNAAVIQPKYMHQ